MSVPLSSSIDVKHGAARTMAEGSPGLGRLPETVDLSFFPNDLSELLAVANAASGNTPILSTTDRLLDRLTRIFSADGNFGKIYH